VRTCLEKPFTKIRFVEWLKVKAPGSTPNITHTKKDTCTTMFIAALFIKAKIWKEPRCPTTNEWIKKMCYLYTMEIYSAIQKNEILPFAGK
jgi:hypothetical protein